MQFDDDLIACAETVQKSDPNRFMAAMAAPVEARPLLFALYAFNVEISRAPWASQESMIAEMRVQWWRDIGAEITAGGPVRRHYVATPLARLVNHEAAQVIDAMAEARRWDIYREPFEDDAALDAYIDATAGGLMWMAAASIGAAQDRVVRDYAYAAGLANYLSAVPELEAQKRIPLLDGSSAGVRALAERGLDRLSDARRARALISPGARPALLAGWQAEAILKQARAEPQRVAAGALGVSEFRKRLSLMWQAGTGRW
ncbi:squalene/phytoene synthase family protein [Phaeobacter sp. HF9A]|uniref:squalene/phytoene synthase family protein n=1 Tax=Phaeobacter sp. HF9A TaxID=2721561 RepID=UPI0014316CAE|nr:squalene/phytoene synthase family protein [Phaeobacter sp. HF9A]NIZ12674.1 squalene/phytoene synthase family protein [Phaeobacter sp. HF9A]